MLPGIPHFLLHDSSADDVADSRSHDYQMTLFVIRMVHDYNDLVVRVLVSLIRPLT